MGLIEPIRTEFDRELKTCRRLLERVREDRFDWRPHPKSFSLRELSCHLVNVVGWVEPLLTLDHLSIQPEDRGWGARTWLELMERFDRNRERALDLMRDPPDHDLHTEWRLKAGSRVVYRARRIEALRFIISHVIHHRGQLSVYLRLNDIPVPPIYGPTADEPA